METQKDVVYFSDPQRIHMEFIIQLILLKVFHPLEDAILSSFWSRFVPPVVM